MGTGRTYELRLAQEAKKRKAIEAVRDDAKTSLGHAHSSAMRQFQEGTAEAMDLAFNGLVSKEMFRARQTNMDRVSQNDDENADKEVDNKRKQERKHMILSFGVDDEEGEDGDDICPLGEGGKTARLGKDPKAQTDFLPDRDKELKEEQMRQLLEEEYRMNQESIRAEPLSITYSYYNGSGHRRSVTIRKGDSVLQFLKCVQAQLRDSFREIKSSSSSDLMYVKEDVILPHTMTFYELITKKAQGRSGPLFRFDVQEHITSAADCRLPPMDSHPGKVVERHWYANNKHIHPFNKWEIFKPEKHYTSQQ